MGIPAAPFLVLLLAGPPGADVVDFGTTVAGRVRLLRHDNPAVRARAATLLGHAPPDEAIAGLLEALDDPVPGVRLQVAGALARLADERAVPFLARALRAETSPRVLAALLFAAARSGGPYLALRVEPFLEHPAQAVRAAAATALGELGDAGQRDALWSALRLAPDDPGLLVRAAVLRAFVRLEWREDVVRAIGELEAQGAHRHWAARAAILTAIGDAEIAERTAWLVAQLEREPDPRVLAAGVGALGRLGRRAEVEDRLDDGRPAVRRAALVALEEIDPAAAAGRALAMVRGDEDVDVRFEAALVLARLDHPDADRYLIDALRSRNPVYWITALAALERRHGRSYGRDPAAWTAALRRDDG